MVVSDGEKGQVALIAWYQRRLQTHNKTKTIQVARFTVVRSRCAHCAPRPPFSFLAICYDLLPPAAGVAVSDTALVLNVCDSGLGRSAVVDTVSKLSTGMMEVTVSPAGMGRT